MVIASVKNVQEIDSDSSTDLAQCSSQFRHDEVDDLDQSTAIDELPNTPSQSPEPQPSASISKRQRKGKDARKGKETSTAIGKGRGRRKRTSSPPHLVPSDSSKAKRQTKNKRTPGVAKNVAAASSTNKQKADDGWKKQGRTESRKFTFTGKPGINRMPDDITSPLDFLHLFLPDSEIQKFVDHTNKYAEDLISNPEVHQRLRETSRSIFKTWKDTNKDEIWMYITVCLAMGIVRKPEYDMYWTNDPMFETPIFTRLMSRTRFKQLRKMIHFSEPIDCDKEDPLHKLREILDNLSERFESVYTPERNVCIDKYLSLWKGRLSFRIYIPSKRERYGIKIYMNCESSSGYLLGFIVYVGSGTDYGDAGTMTLSKPFDDFKTPSKVVLALLRNYVNQGYTVTLDNLYTSPELASTLFNHKTNCFGTLRKKEGLPHDFWLWKPVKGEEPTIHFKENLMVLRWDDVTKTRTKKVVSMLSTMHTGKLVDTGRIHRLTKEPILKPDVILDYNGTMGGVDTLSRVIIPYNSQRRGLKWYRKLAELFIEISCYNSFILWKKLNPGSKVDNLRFRKMLIDELVTFYSYGSKSYQTGRLNVSGNPLRLTERHFIASFPNVSSKKKYPQSRCVVCAALNKRKDSRYWCPICKVGLCIDNCFKVYHTRDITRNADEDDDSSEEI